MALVLKTFVKDKALVVDLYEAEADFTEFGAGIALSDRPRSILYKLGLEKDLKPRIRDEKLMCRKSDSLNPVVFHSLGAPSK